MKKIIKIRGTHCQACKALIEDVCSEIKGVVSCNLDYKTGDLEIEYNSNFNFKKLKEEIAALGNYTVSN